ncbi:MAG: glycosyltransferase [Proteobacteria bacterium]|nr:glycosyltransferase [Pseudomonadota bacterium]
MLLHGRPVIPQLPVIPKIDAYRLRPASPGRLSGGRRCADLLREDRPDRPLISVVTPVFNGVRYLAEALASVRAQTYDNVEQIVVDGGSTDGTIELLRAHEESIDYWISERDQGMYDAYNKGIALARGRYIKNLNHDDLLSPQSAALALGCFAEHGDEVCVNSELELIDGHGRRIERLGFDRQVRFAPPFLHPSWYVPRTIYERQGLYCVNYRIASDQEYFLRLRQAGVPFVRAGAVLASFRVGGMSSGYGGVRESFGIFGHYVGWPQAAYVTAVMAWKKTRSNLIHAALGERAHHVVARLKRWRFR